MPRRKARLFEMQSAGHAAVIGIGDAPSAADRAAGRGARGAARTSHKIASGRVHGSVALAGAAGAAQRPERACRDRRVRGAGRRQAAIDSGLRDLPGLPHRMERVAERNGVLFVNDSKATNAESTAPALAAYPRVHWIVGGRAKTRRARRLPTAASAMSSAPTRSARRGRCSRDCSKATCRSSDRGTLEAGGAARRGERGSRATRCCCRPPAPRSTSSRIMRRGGAGFPRGGGGAGMSDATDATPAQADGASAG